jgi:hypothetical protein
MHRHYSTRRKNIRNTHLNQSELNKKKPKNLETIENYIEDVISLSKVLEWGGVSFGKNEWFKIKLALKVYITNIETNGRI